VDETLDTLRPEFILRAWESRPDVMNRMPPRRRARSRRSLVDFRDTSEARFFVFGTGTVPAPCQVDKGAPYMSDLPLMEIPRRGWKADPCGAPCGCEQGGAMV